MIRGEPDWHSIDELRAEWDGPFIVKGIQKVGDAERLIARGVDAIWVSNHAGRQFDGGPASIDCLPAIRSALPRTPIIYDSGIQGGLDILRALALGADFVMLGRAFHYALGAVGAKGPEHLIHILSQDLQSNMGQIGAQNLRAVADHLIRP